MQFHQLGGLYLQHTPCSVNDSSPRKTISLRPQLRGHPSESEPRQNIVLSQIDFRS